MGTLHSITLHMCCGLASSLSVGGGGEGGRGGGRGRKNSFLSFRVDICRHRLHTQLGRPPSFLALSHFLVPCSCFLLLFFLLLLTIALSRTLPPSLLFLHLQKFAFVHAGRLLVRFLPTHSLRPSSFCWLQVIKASLLIRCRPRRSCPPPAPPPLHRLRTPHGRRGGGRPRWQSGSSSRLPSQGWRHGCERQVSAKRSQLSVISFST